MKNLLLFIWKRNRFLLIASNLTIGLTAYLSVMVVKQTKVVIDALEDAHIETLFKIILLAVLYAAANTVTQFIISIISSRTKNSLQSGLAHQLLKRPFSEVEPNGPKIVNGIYRECQTIGKTLASLCNAGRNIVILLSLLGYALYLSPVITSIALLGRLLFSFFVRKVKYQYRKLLNEERETQNTMHRNLSLLVSGFKELSLNTVLRRAFYEKAITDSCELNKRQNIRIGLIRNGLTTAIEVLVLVMGICLVYVAIVRSMLDLATATNLLIVFIMARVQMANASNSALKLEEFRASANQLELLGFDITHLDESAPRVVHPISAKVDSIAFQNVGFQYDDIDGKNTFSLTGLNFTFNHPGVFMFIGGNGSGKSTIAKLLCGLYSPSCGHISLNGSRIDAEDLDAYRQLFSTVFSNFQLFGSAFRENVENPEEKIAQLFEEFALTEHVPDHYNEPTEALSTGQRKRLALALSLIEDKPVYIFDEWAAEQDPQFREYFYTVILQRLKTSGKFVFVITHHQDFIHVADQVYSVDSGSVELLQKNEIKSLSPGQQHPRQSKHQLG